MAFKRDGDDLSQLNALRKRRVADLLASYIPEDEAILLKSGRYACSVCSYRPVFDTVDMLAVHRTGKKHITSLQRFYGQKRDLQLEVQKHRHRQHIQEEESGSEARPEQEHLPPLLRKTRQIAHHALLKAAPYNSYCKRKRSGDDVPTPSPTTSASASGNQWAGTPGAIPGWTGASAEAQEGRQPEGAPPGSQTEGGTRRGRQRKASACRPPPCSADADPARQKLLEYHLHLRSSGWIQDPCGKWVRDGAAEFDSDEEDPPALPPP
ncbi:sodium channel modifier 1 [Pristis pectinata]|uniref:sodium channel modifier 1 n=1 Tax=Pristis pectinata TaxID=685728 RepID=UPI00223D6518|nr:sodium channel modifier 1 [Pristis pectinata]